MKKLRILFYKWHNWVGIILSIPIFIVSASAILLAFKDTLNLDRFYLSTAFMPGYYLDAQNISFKKYAENVKCILIHKDSLFIGTKFGLVLVDERDLWFEKDFLGVDIRKIVKIKNKIYIAGNKGIWMKEENYWKKLFSGDVHDIEIGKDGQLFAALAKSGIITSSDNFKTISTKWTDYLKDRMNNSEFSSELKSETKAKVTLKDFVLDLHTGRAFFGKQREWIWITMVALSIIILVITGSVLWVRKKMRRVIN